MTVGPIGANFHNDVTPRLEDLQKRLQTDVRRLLGQDKSAAVDGADITSQTRLTNRLRGLHVLSRGVQEGISLIQTADATLAGTTEDLQRIRDLTVQAANGTNSDSDRAAIQQEIDSLSQGIDASLQTAQFNGQAIFGQTRDIQVGDQGSVPVQFPELSVRVLAGGPIKASNVQAAQYAIPQVDRALSQVADVRQGLGSAQNRLERSVEQLRSAAQNVVSASTIGQPSIVDSIVDLRQTETQLKAALKVSAAQLQTSDSVLELLK